MGLRLVRRWASDQSTWLEWLALWGLVGLGMLLKQSVLLFAIALPLFVVIEWRRLSWRPVLVAQQLVGLRDAVLRVA